MKKFLFFLLITSALFAQNAKKSSWKLELQNDVKKFTTLQNGKFLFLTSDERAWLVQPDSGKILWQTKIEDYEEKGIHQLVNDSLYLVSSSDSLFYYAPFSDTLLWKVSFKEISQDDFKKMYAVDTLLVLRYEDYFIGVSAASGSELWRIKVDVNSSLVENGTVNTIVLPLVMKMLVVDSDGKIHLYSLENGSELLKANNPDLNDDLVKQKRAWFYITNDQRNAAFVLDDGFVVYNLDSAKQVWLIKDISINADVNVLLPTSTGCALVGDEKFVHCNFAEGTSVQVAADAEDIRNYTEAKFDSTTVLLLSLKNKMISIDITHNKTLWTSAKESKQYEGFLYSVVKQQNDNVICLYANPESGVKLSLMSLNAWSDTVQYKTTVAFADQSLPTVELPLKPIAAVNSLSKVSFGYENLGFAFSTSQDADSLEVFIVTKTEMRNPKSLRDGGEGLAKFDMTTGKEIFSNYSSIANDFDFNGGLENIMKPLLLDNAMYVAGNENFVKIDRSNGKVVWTLTDEQLNGGYVFAAKVVDGYIFLKTGGIHYGITVEKKSKKKDEKKYEATVSWEDNHYAFLAVDTSNGKVLWRKEINNDPALFSPAYSFEQYLSPDHKHLLYADKDYLYSLPLNPFSAGNVSWKFELDDSGAGSLSLDKLFAKGEVWNMQTTSETPNVQFPKITPHVIETITKLGQAFDNVMTQDLYVTYSANDSQIIIFGDDAIVAVTPDSGRVQWVSKWDYSAEDMKIAPIITQQAIFYRNSDRAVLLNRNTGKIIWNVEVDGDIPGFVLPNRSAFITIKDDEISGNCFLTTQ